MRTTPGTLDFWYDFASPYSHIVAHIIEAFAAEWEVEVRWKPFLLGPIFKAQGWPTSPFNLFPAKGAYMWRDVERECERLSVPFLRPSEFPRRGSLATKVAFACESETWLPTFVKRTFIANFLEDLDIGDLQVLRGLLIESGCPAPDAVLASTAGRDISGRLRARTEQAVQLGIFGAPTFVFDGELYWGSDRLIQAMERASTRRMHT